ncbi:MAG TPA: hypothetical protein PKI08_05955 [Aquaticitalea sp.]|nr:hypothetical protein [Aquaticitalea sp.]
MKEKAIGKMYLPIVVFLLSVVFLSNGLATYLDYRMIVQITQAIAVVAILTLYYTKLNAMANIFLTVFLLFLWEIFFRSLSWIVFQVNLQKSFIWVVTYSWFLSFLENSNV